MKFYELQALFNKEMSDVKRNTTNSPTHRFIMTAYANVVKKLRDSRYRDTSQITESKINNLDITKHMKEKLIDLNKTKLSARAEQELAKAHMTNKLKSDLIDLLGIGEQKADELIKDGLKSIAQLKLKKWNDKLNLDTKLILEHKPERHIKYNEIAALEQKLIGFNKKTMIVGSYRRHKPIMRDIDILFVANKKQTIENYIKYLEQNFKNNIWIYATGQDKASLIIRAFGKKYKVDIFITTPDNYYAMLLYTTGSKQNNIRMRAKARSLGYVLNQNGIFDKDTGKRIDKPTDNEKKLFSILELNYIEPEKRI
jgi:DNA polymerase/3'-5' exonuclease PolX